MKLLWISGDHDFNAVDFEESSYTVESVAKEVEGMGKVEYGKEDSACWFFAELFDFGVVDPAFLDFVDSYIQDDYDTRRCQQYYVIQDN